MPISDFVKQASSLTIEIPEFAGRKNCQTMIPAPFLKQPCQPKTGWWLTYPSEKYESQLGIWKKENHVPNHQTEKHWTQIQMMNQPRRFTCSSHPAESNLLHTRRGRPTGNSSTVFLLGHHLVARKQDARFLLFKTSSPPHLLAPIKYAENWESSAAITWENYIVL